MKGYITLLKYLGPYKKRLFLAIVCLFGATGTQLFLPWIMKDVIDKVLISKDMALLNTIVIAIILMFILRGFFVYGQQYLMAFIAQRVMVDIRYNLFSSMMSRRGLSYYGNNKTGRLMSFYTNDVNALQSAIVGHGIDFTTEVFILIFSVASMTYIDWKMTFLLFITVPALAFAVDRIGKRIRREGSQVQSELAELTSLLQEVLSGIRVVKSFAREDHENDRFRDQVFRNLKAVMRATKATALLTPIVEFLATLGIAALIWYGGSEVISGRLTPGELITFLMFAVNLSNPLKRISRTWANLQLSMAAADRIFGELDFIPEIEDKPNAPKMNAPYGRVEFDHVNFFYNPDEPIIKDFTFTAEHGQIVALVGHSGAGKTTLVNLIPRFYDIQSGHIRIDGQDIKDVAQQSLREKIGMVPQETLLFSGSIMENIRYGRLDATDDEIIAAARAANATEFIDKMPLGFATPVGERGMMLSGGQRQRIAIARAILKNPQILILDEATSALDTESERLVQSALDVLLKGRTSFIIAHRLSTIFKADVILVMKDGQIVEKGTHAELLAKCGVYTKLYETQFGKENTEI